ncbi:MAG: glycosyltransferase, partial [Terriglobales bacterium]
SHHVIAPRRKVAYWHSPAKWLYSRATYKAAGSPLARATLAVTARGLERRDRAAVATIDRHLCNSTAVRDRLRQVYGIDAEIVFPPVHRPPDPATRPIGSPQAGFLLCVSRLIPYKNVGAIVGSMALLPKSHLVVVGSGPLDASLRRNASSNVTFLRGVDEPELSWLYANCSFVVAASHEDFGLTPVEGALYGRPAVVLGAGGYLDTVEDGVTGVFFEAPLAQCIAHAVVAAVRTGWDEHVIRRRAQLFSLDRFRERIERVVLEEAGTHD